MDQISDYEKRLQGIEDKDKKIGECDHPKDQRSVCHDDGNSYYVKSVCNKCGGTIYEPRQR